MTEEEKKENQDKSVENKTEAVPEIIDTNTIEEIIDDSTYKDINGFDNPFEVTESTEAQIVRASLSNDENEKLSIFQTLVNGRFLPSHIKTAETAFSIAQMGKELGMQPMQSFHQIISIKGRLTLSAKAQGALLKKGGVIYEVLKYNEYVYLNLDGQRLVYSPVPLFKRSSDEYKNHYYTNITTIKFSREYPVLSGGFHKVEETISFSLSDAHKQGLLTKDNWERMQPEMLYARCLARGANIVGPDLMLGLYSTQEILDSL